MHIEFNYKSQRRLCWTTSSAIYTIQFEHNCAQQCLIQSDVEQLLGARSVHSFALVYLISSQLLLKATDLNWVQDNSFTIEAVDNIHLLKHVPLKAYIYNDNIEYCQVIQEGTKWTWDFSRFQGNMVKSVCYIKTNYFLSQKISNTMYHTYVPQPGSLY